MAQTTVRSVQPMLYRWLQLHLARALHSPQVLTGAALASCKRRRSYQ